VSFVCERDGGPAVVCSLAEDAVRLNSCERVKTIIVAGCAIGDVEWCRRVVESIGVDDVVESWGRSLVDMSVTVDIYIHTPLIKEVFKSCLAVCAHRRRSGEVPI
jgi:hypothetical protein